MQQYIARSNCKSAGETRLFKCTAQHHRGIARDVSMPWNKESGIERFDSEPDRPVCVRAVWSHTNNYTPGQRVYRARRRDPVMMSLKGLVVSV